MANLTIQPQKTYLHYCNANGHLTWQCDGLPWGAPTHKVTWPFDHVILWDHVAIKNIQYQSAYVHKTWEDDILP